MRIIPTILFVLRELSPTRRAHDLYERGRVHRLRHVNVESRLEAPPSLGFLDMRCQRHERRVREWPRSELTFRRRDRNGNGAIERNEFPGQRDREDEAAYRHGYDRGLTDGRAAGRGDRNQGRKWDLEGQRELEQADAGYTQNAGEREDYQAGYRAGFRVGYEQGYNRR